jgi:hypothetical protein
VTKRHATFRSTTGGYVVVGISGELEEWWALYDALIDRGYVLESVDEELLEDVVAAEEVPEYPALPPRVLDALRRREIEENGETP